MGYWTEGNRTIGVLGLGISGRAAAVLLKKSGFTVVGLDARMDIEIPDSCDRIVTGEGIAGSLEDLDGLILSPGVDPNTEIPLTAVEMGLPVIGEIELAFRHTAVPILAVTGSNGKTTTVEWLGYILRSAGVNAVVAGNTGFPFSSAVISDQIPEFFVLEISSYQLQSIRKFRPAAAAILNVTPDHLQRHGNIDRYRTAKARIFMNQHNTDLLVLNRDDPGSVPLAGRTQGFEWYFGIGGKVQDGAYSDKGSIYTANSGESSYVMDISDLSLQGEHNLANALAVVCLSMKAGLEPLEMNRGLRTFAGVVHRIEWLRDVGGVSWVNDSKSTNPDSLVVALRTFNRPIVLIAGGQAKQTDYGALKDLIRHKVKTLILIGTETDLLLKTWEGTADIFVEEVMEKAVRRAVSSAEEGDVVLLSPGCASFDQYSNFEERGEHFRELVENLS